MSIKEGFCPVEERQLPDCNCAGGGLKKRREIVNANARKRFVVVKTVDGSVRKDVDCRLVYWRC